MPPTEIRYWVEVSYKDRQEQATQKFGPADKATAYAVLTTLAARSDVLRATIVSETN